MMHLIYRLQELNFPKLMELYSESNRENAEEQYSWDDTNLAILKVEQDFYQYLNEVFFQTKGAFYAVWEENGRYKSALRVEPYRDGLLLEALETHPDYRNLGYAKCLVNAALELLKGEGNASVYSHVNKRNVPSLRTHLSCGFCRVSEYAVYIDGNVNSQCCTLQYRFSSCSSEK